MIPPPKKTSRCDENELSDLASEHVPNKARLTDTCKQTYKTLCEYAYSKSGV